ncbi:hypothetical protein BGZ60DRAFT_520055 [Tricladium varicosporioides]|nr:hypothetical protein BGZ60DRAFT_520055 [Hymenoscyphus varicosporioides]
MLETNYKTPYHYSENVYHNPTFEPFPRLPQELRLRIWKLAALSTIYQVVDIPLSLMFPVPPLLHTSQEARSESKTVYTELRIRKLSVSVRLDAIWLWNQLDPVTMRPIKDVIVNSTPRIQKLAIRLDTWFTFCLNEKAWISRSGEWWDTMRYIQELAIVIGCSRLGKYQFGVYPREGSSLILPRVKPRDVFAYFYHQKSISPKLRALGITNGERWEDLEKMAADFLLKAWQRKRVWAKENHVLLKDKLLRLENWKLPDLRYYELNATDSSCARAGRRVWI